MAKYEAKIKTKFGEIVFNFETLDELRTNLESLDVNAIAAEVSTKFGGLILKEPRLPKPGMEGIYRFTPEGKVELLRTAPSAPMAMGLLLYTYDPEPVSSEDILSSAGVKAADYVHQAAYKKYFDKTSDDKHVLTHPGRQWVESDIIPKLADKADKQSPK
jgi:hypothetical protein